ncbi:MAG: EAL domain-containing protein [Marinobacter sp.]|nr:EAL domain-containing protein [Marinobacter sp.]
MLYYQPQIRNPNQLLGYEVLLRWRHPERGIVSPAVFHSDSRTEPAYSADRSVDYRTGV